MCNSYYSTVKGGGKLLNIINDLPQECDVMIITSDTCGRLFFQKKVISMREKWEQAGETADY